MGWRDSKGGSKLLPLSSVFELTEASAYRITPTYVFAYRKSKKGTGVVPVRIKHGNVPKHWANLTDPDPGSPLANTVIGQIPKYYKAATDLKPKDATKKLSDLMSSDYGEEPSRIEVPALPAQPKAKKLTKAQQQAQELGAKLLYTPNSPKMKVLAALIKHGNDGEAVEALAGSSDDDAAIEQAIEDVASVIETLKAHPEFASHSEDEDEGITYVDFKPAAFSPVVAAPVAAPPPPEPVKAAPPPPPPPAPKPEADLLQPQKDPVAAGGMAIYSLGAEFVAGQVSPEKQMKLLDALDLPFLGAASFVSLGAIASHEGDTKASFKKAIADALLKAYPNSNADKTDAAASAFLDAAVKADIVVEAPGGSLFVVGADDKILVSPSKKKQPSVGVAPVPAPAPVPMPAPVAAPSVPAVPVQGGLGLPAIPPLSSLQNAGNAKSVLGGYHDKSFLKDGAGNKFLFKPAEKKQAQAGAVYAAIGAQVLDHTVPVVAGEVGGQFGSVQPVISNVKTDLSQVALTDLSPSQLDSLLKERVLDWALSSHDTKAANFLLTTDGKLVGIDKEQAFRFLGNDSLDTTYKPNPTKQVYSDLFNLFKKKKLDLNVGAMVPAIEKIEAMSDEQWIGAVQPYIDALPPTERGPKLAAILNRKKNLRKDLEGFLTGLMRERGDIGLTDTFEFPKADIQPVQAAPAEPAPKKKKKKKDVGGALATPAPMGSVLSPVPMPNFASLTTKNEKLVGSTGESYLFYGPNGEKYVVKKAVNRNLPTKQEPWRAVAQEIFSKVSSVVRPGKSLAVGIIPGGWGGVPATIQPWVEGSTPIGKSADPAKLTNSEKKDIAEEHALDWLLSQHDTHGANLLKRPDGTVISIDKEQGFKFLLPNPAGQDVLSTDFHPNKVEAAPYYNSFWRAFSEGKMDFDPREMKDVIARIESIPDSDYAKLLSNYTAIAPFSTDNPKLLAFLERAMSRKQNIRADFEKFLTGLYKKRTKSDGAFSFENGWVLAGATPPAPGQTPTAPEKKPKKKKKLEGALSLQTPYSTGALGIPSPELVKAGETPATKPPPLPPVPAGYPKPPAGKMWKVSPAIQFLADGGGVVYKTKPVKDPATGQIDPNSPNQLVKFAVNESEAADILSKAGVTPVVPLKTKGDKVIAVVSKEEWGKALSSGKEIGVLVDIPPPPPPPSGKFTTIPKPGALKNPEATNTLDDLREVGADKTIGYGKNFVVDGPAVENQSLKVTRKTDAAGKTFYEVNFKLRAPYLSKISGGTPADLTLDRFKYDADTDSWLQTGKASNPAEQISDMLRWDVPSSSSTVYIGKSPYKYAFKGAVVARVYPGPGESVGDALEKALTAVGPTFAKNVLKEPTEAEEKLNRLAALFWSVAPQESDALSESERTVENLTAKLKEKGVTQEQVDSIRQEEVALGISVPVLPNRHKKIQETQNISHVSIDVSQVDRVIKQLRSGTIGVNERAFQGLPVPESDTSPNQDQISGGGDYVFCNAVRKNGGKFYRWGPISMVYDPSEMDRLDAFVHQGDYYGATDPKAKGGAFTDRQSVETGAGTSAEICFKRGINARKLLKIACKDAGTAAKLIAELKAAGITEMNGMKPEELVVHVPTPDEFYKTYLQPAGY